MKNYVVYVHINKINNKMYFGITCQNTDTRWKNGHGYKKGNPYFWNAICKYGWENFYHIVLFKDLSKELANIIESELVKIYNTTDKKYGYNLMNGGNSNRHTEYTKRKIKENHADVSGDKNPFYGKHHTKETINKIKNKLNGKFVKEKSPVYKRKHTPEAIEKMSGERPSVKGENNPRARKINQYDLDRNFIRSYWGCMEVKELYGYDNSAIAKCCKGIVKTSYGYIWRYADE